MFDIFTFKKEATKVFSKENFVHLLEATREEIIKRVKDNIPGVEKKFIVDEIIIGKIEFLKDTCKNKIVKWLLDLISSYIPAITQIIYNFLKEKVENL